jgi:hypothetical protein
MPTTFYPVRDTLIKASLRLVGAYNSNSQPSADQMQDAAEAINFMLKSWQVDGFLWLKKFALLTLVPGQATYLLGPAADGTPSPDVCVYQGTATQVDRPTRIQAAAYRNSSGFDRPLTPMSRDEYIKLTNKTNQAPCVQFYYNPQLYQGEITVWPVPATADTIFFTCDRGIADLLNDTDTPDVPQEWLRLIKFGLAVEIAPEYAMPAGELARLEQRYNDMRKVIDDYDREPSVSYFEVER